ncbi:MULTISPECIES: hypothetical protein [unclassified Streptomyces]|uniref:hypothetical protein n=1 Tax=unclassified Streptomyces TaxID=2593676 RepID=UPI0013708B31|nr:hypothetical protein [Streptomyces sp. SHP 1-2]MCW5251031.1 hypothetical protein [Streptomyces sp. SHP 1-2]MYU22786.1 hypothetical protein [Streptomyces sp. SID8352]
MSPPPPPLGRARRRAGHPFDEALDDAELTTARAALAQGRWQSARSLITRTGVEWDRRGHRISVLAAERYCAAWAREWLLAEPDSTDASLLLAFALVRRALRGKEKPAAAREACRSTAALVPEDPTPWLGLLVLERELGTDDDVVRAFEAVRGRYADHHHAHHLMVARLAEQRAEDGPDPLHEVYDFANWAAEQAPADSPLAILPVVAHAERYRVLAAAGHESADPRSSGHWVGRRARLVMKAAFDWWLEWEQDGHPRRLIDLNFLAHAKSCEGRGAEAAALFHRIGPHATPAPWAYPDREPYAAFRAARADALGTA